MFRDFSNEAKEKLLSYVDDVTDKSTWDKVGDAISDIPAHVQHWLGWLNTSRYVNNMDAYHKKVIDKNDMTQQQIEDIFSNVKAIDGRYENGISGEVTLLKNITKFIADLASTINPNGGNLEMGRLSGVLAADLSEIKKSRTTKEEIIENSMLGTDPEGASTSIDPVNLSTGNFIYEHKDLEVLGEIPLFFHRYYNSKDARIGALGKGFRHNYEISLLEKKDGTIDIALADGQHRYFFKADSGKYVSAEAICESLEKNENSYIYKSTDDKRFIFKLNGTLSRIETVKGIGVTFQYDEKEQLVKAITDNKDFLQYHYNEKGYIEKIEDHAGRNVSVEYDGVLLKSVKMPSNIELSYGYGRNGRITEVVNTQNVVSVENDYDNQFRVVRQKFPDGGIMEFEYQDDEKTVIQTERNGSKTKYIHDEKYRTTEIIYEDETRERMLYNEKNQCISKVNRLGYISRMSYDNKGNLTQMIDSKKQRVNYTYNAANRLTNVSINGKEYIKNNYDSFGNLVYTEDALGHFKEMCYDEKGRLIKEKLSDGFCNEYSYDEKGNVILSKDIFGAEEKFVYDKLNRLSESVDGNGNVTKYTYDDSNRITGVIDALGSHCTYKYTSNNKVSEICDFDGNIISKEYDTSGRLIAETDKEGNKTQYTYDKMWNVDSILLSNGGIQKFYYDKNNHLKEVYSENGGKYEFTYDAAGNRKSVISPDGNKTEFAYDSENRITAITESSGAVTRCQYDMFGNLSVLTDANGNEILMSYDMLGNRISYTDELGNTTHYEYNLNGDVSKIIYPNGSESVYTYEAGGRLKSIREANGFYEEYNYDLNGNIIERINGLGEKQTFKYDALDRITEITNPIGGVCHLSYDKVGNLIQRIDEEGAVTKYEYTPNGKVSRIIDADGNPTCYEYDSMGVLSKYVRWGGESKQETQYERDLAGNIVKITNPLGDIEQYFYDKCGHLLSMIDQDGYQTSYSYNKVGQVESITYADNRKVNYSYNMLRQLEEINDWIGKTSIQLDKMGRPTMITDPYGEILKYEWNCMGERSKVVYPNGDIIDYTYNAANQLTGITNGDIHLDYEYDSIGRFNSRKMSNGLELHYSYNKLGKIHEIKNMIGKELIEHYQYQYDLMGNKIETVQHRKNMPETDGRYQYSYDARHQLTAIGKNGKISREYGYDFFGNRTILKDVERNLTTNYSYNSNNQLIKEISADYEKFYEYDRRGNVQNVYENGKLSKAYVFDTANQMSHAKDLHSGVSRSYLYGGLGHRMEQRTEYDFGNDHSKWDHAIFTVDMTRRCHNMVSRKDSLHNRQQMFFYDGKVSYMKDANLAMFYMSDDHGTPTSLWDDHNDCIENYRYDEFGIPAAGLVSQIQPFGYTGYQIDDVSNLYYAQARYYNPNAGRFISEDIVRGILAEPTTLNRYTYCWNRPEDYEDNDGEFPTVVVGAIVGGLVSAVVETGMQVYKGVREGKSIGESFSDVEWKKVALEFGKGAVKGAIAGTGAGLVVTALSTGATDAVGEVVEQKWIDKEEKIDFWEVGETFVWSTASSAVAGAVAKKITTPKKALGNKIGANTKITDVANRGAAYDTVKEQLGRKQTEKAYQKIAARLSDKRKELATAIALYTGSELYSKTYSKVQGELYKNKLKNLFTTGVEYVRYCALAS